MISTVVVSQRARAWELLGIKPGKWPIVLFVNSLAIILPSSLGTLSAFSEQVIGLFLLCALVQSAALYYGMDLLQPNGNSYLRSLAAYFLTTLLIAMVGLITNTQEISLRDGTHIPYGGTTNVVFALVQLENLPFALLISPLWMAIRWLENTIQVAWFRRNHRKVL